VLYIILFLEGIMTFISPCLLPLLPVYISYLSGGGEKNTVKHTLRNACGFILGFTLVFVALGAFAGLAGSVLLRYQTAINAITGTVVLLFGLSYLGVINLPLLNGYGAGKTTPVTGFFSSVLFGFVFSIAWTPCVGAFLGSALMLASQQGSALQGTLLLLCYSVGLGVPFVLSAVLIERLKSTIDFIKKHYKAINMVSGVFLIAVGILMMTGTMGRLLALLAF
jgi:Cytochrome c biogenesis protein